MIPKHVVTLFYIAVLLFLRSGECYNILVIAGHPGKSHFDAFSAFFEELAGRGHNLTILSHVGMDNVNNIKPSTLRARTPSPPTLSEHIPLRNEGPMTHVMDLDLMNQGNMLMHHLSQQKLIADFAKVYCEHDLKTPQFQKFLEEDQRFDVILVEMFNTNCYNGLIRKFNAPFIGLSSCDYFSWQAKWFGISSNPAYIQNVFFGFKEPMSFLARVETTMINIYSDLWYKFGMERPGNELSRKYIGYDVPDPHNASLFLVNTHYTLTGVKPLTPSVVEVGGIHVDNRKISKLPEDIERWMNNSDEGIIYFSLGSMIKGDTFPEEQRSAFVRAFAKLPQRVLWKWENDTMQDKPDNVMIAKWMPQFDILCHPKVKLFISHGGLLGITEAIHCGVPLILMPQFGDQTHNAHAVENRGAGVILHLQTATEEKVSNALRKALDPEMYKNAKALSDRFRDRPLSPMDTAIYWVEHIARHKGGQHMRSRAIDLPFYQYFLLDVIAFLGLITLLVFYVLYKCMKLVSSFFKTHSKTKKHKVL